MQAGQSEPSAHEDRAVGAILGARQCANNVFVPLLGKQYVGQIT
jgi:hypothetical protein